VNDVSADVIERLGPETWDAFAQLIERQGNASGEDEL
jgi:hypothetical protein